MIQTKVFNPENKPNTTEKESIINFLFENLQEYGDPKSDIEKCINYALKETTSFGGFVLVSFLENEISGVVIVNQTGMKDYIPENILVYIATHKDHRGKGIGKFLMQKAIELTEGSIALHVEPENPARFLYEKVGFSSKYVEMRLKK
ncbi:GNAT family N-acetyltransferase [Ancylomarina sp.]|uniref:GNAT family N-acetyltransferase n=1 Tax=Ancylomarina sp. TaxID=1970196 RepID=UPI003564D7CC